MYQYLKDLAPRKRSVALNSLPPTLDITDDVLVGDIVIDTDSTNVWTCIDNNNGAAVYIKFGEVVHANTTSRDATNCHPATAISYSNVDLTATEVGGALDELTYRNKYLGTAGEDLVAGNLCYLKSDGKMWKANATIESTAKGFVAIALSNISTSATGNFLKQGTYTTTGLTTASEYFMDTTGGAITVTKPSTVGNIVRIIGYALSTTILEFNPDRTYIEIA